MVIKDFWTEDELDLEIEDRDLGSEEDY